MRKLRVFESISVDGYFTDARGDMGFAHGTDPEFAAWVGQNASGSRELLFGRKTYEMMAAFWPTPLAAAQMPEVARGMNAATKYVVSRSLDARWGWENTQRLGGELVASVRALKEGEGPDVTVLGSGEITAQLGAAGLIDEYQFVVVPVALGSGRTVFTRGEPLRLRDHRAFSGGNVVLTYGAGACLQGG